MWPKENGNEREVREVHRRSGAIRVRQWWDSDAGQAQRFLGKHRDFNPGRDSTFVAELDGRIVGIFAERLIPVVHVFEVEESPVMRRVAEALANYATGYTKASNQTEAMFLTDPDNHSIHRFIEERGGVKDPPAEIYFMGVL